MAHHPNLYVAYDDMMHKLSVTSWGTRGAASIFEGFPTAALAFGVAVGGLVAAFIFYWCVIRLSLGPNAHPSHMIQMGTRIRDVFVRNNGGIEKVSITYPELVAEDRRTSSSFAHLCAIIGAWGIAIFGGYSAFMVFGVSPQILISIGVVSIVFVNGVGPLVSETRDSVRVHWGNRIREGDYLNVFSLRLKGQVTWMGSNYMTLEEYTATGYLLVHQISYTAAISQGFTRYVTGGPEQCMGKLYKDSVALQKKHTASTWGGLVAADKKK